MKVEPLTLRLNRPGITLIEVLLALAIFLLAMVPIFRLVDLGTESALETQLQSDGTRLAQSKLAEVEAGVISPVSGGSGTFEDEISWSWEVQSVQTQIPNLFNVTVTVSHPFGGKTHTVTLSQMVLDPAQMGTASEIPNPESTESTP